MTEAEWLAESKPYPMAVFLLAKRSDRKHRLCVCGLARLAWDRFPVALCREAIEAAERFVDSGIELEEIRRIHQNAMRAAREVRADSTAEYFLVSIVEVAAETFQTPVWALGSAINYLAQSVSDSEVRTALEHSETQILRDIFGNPFRPVTLDPRWFTSDVVALARGIYEERAFDRLPILADALQDAGCENADVLNHCRGPEPHVRGCWVVDLILGKH